MCLNHTLMYMYMLYLSFVSSDHVFDESATTEQIYTTLTKPIVHSVMEGFNGETWEFDASVNTVLTASRLVVVVSAVYSLYVIACHVLCVHAGTVFAYGQTSSGKTFTMMGMEEHPGVIPLAIDEIFAYIEEVRHYTCPY